METELKEELCCPICTDLFTSPLRLPCGHSYCQGCLRAMVKHPEPRRAAGISRWLHEDEGGEEVILSCPECRREYVLDDRGVDRFQSDFKLAKLVELYRKLDMTSLTDSEGEEDKKDTDESKPADRPAFFRGSSLPPESRLTSVPVETCEILSNIPTELCADTLLKQVAVESQETGDCPESMERSTSLPDSVSLSNCSSAAAEVVPEFHENHFSEVPKGDSSRLETRNSHEPCHPGRSKDPSHPGRSEDQSQPEGACAMSRSQPFNPLVLPSGHYDNFTSNYLRNNHSTPNLLRMGPKNLTNIPADLTRGTIHPSKSANSLMQNSNQLIPNIQNGESRQSNSNVTSESTLASVTDASLSSISGNATTLRTSRHGNQSPKFPSGNYDNLLDSAAVNQILASAGNSVPSSSNPPTSGPTTNQVPRNRSGSSQSLSSSNSRSSKSANELYDNLRKHSKGAVSLGCSSKQKNSSDDDSKHKESDCSDNDMRMASSVKVTRRRRKKKKNRVASFFSSLLFSESSSSGDYLTTDSEEETKRKEEALKKQKRRSLFYSSSSS